MQTHIPPEQRVVASSAQINSSSNGSPISFVVRQQQELNTFIRKLLVIIIHTTPIVVCFAILTKIFAILRENSLFAILRQSSSFRSLERKFLVCSLERKISLPCNLYKFFLTPYCQRENIHSCCSYKLLLSFRFFSPLKLAERTRICKGFLLHVL